MDLITQLPETLHGHTAILVFVDRLTKMVRLVPSTTTVSSKDFAQAFLREVYSKHGMPKSIVSDRDPRFTSDFYRDFCKELQIEQNMSTAYHPQTDGQTERMNRYVEAILRSFVNPSQDDWDLRLPLVEFSINNAYQASIRNTPFFLNYGRHPRTPANVSVPLRGTSSPLSQAQEVQRSLELAKQCLKDAQHFMSYYANSKRRHVSYEVGDFVLLSSKNLALKSDGVKKLAHRYFGPFEILRKVGPLAYELKIPASMKVHDVFHVSLLKIYKHKDGAITVPPPALLPTGGIEFEINSIKAHKLENGVFHFLIEWKDDDSDTWLEESELSNCKDLLLAYAQSHNLTLSPTRKQQKRAAKSNSRSISALRPRRKRKRRA